MRDFRSVSLQATHGICPNRVENGTPDPGPPPSPSGAPPRPRPAAWGCAAGRRRAGRCGGPPARPPAGRRSPCGRSPPCSTTCPQAPPPPSPPFRVVSQPTLWYTNLVAGSGPPSHSASSARGACLHLLNTRCGVQRKTSIICTVGVCVCAQPPTMLPSRISWHDTPTACQSRQFSSFCSTCRRGQADAELLSADGQ